MAKSILLLDYKLDDNWEDSCQGMQRIPVYFHNVDDKDIFRPHSFNGFGTKDLESADYRACKYYGGLYE